MFMLMIDILWTRIVVERARAMLTFNHRSVPSPDERSFP
jgi:hypothetical protein